MMARGRPQIGTTKKLSLTMPDEDWEGLERIAEAEGKTRSAMIRHIVNQFMRSMERQLVLDEYIEPSPEAEAKRRTGRKASS